MKLRGVNKNHYGTKYTTKRNRLNFHKSTASVSNYINTCEKVGYSSAEVANAAFTKIKNDPDWDKTILYSYLCDRCKYYHLTKKKPSKKNRLN